MTWLQIYDWGIRWLVFLFELSTRQKRCAIQITVFSFASGIVICNPHTAPESDTEGTSQALPHKVLHFFFMLLTLFFTSISGYYRWPPATIRAFSIILRYSLFIRGACQGLQIAFKVCHTVVFLFLAYCWEDGTLKYLNILTNKDYVAQ